jgi:hypothetical protein
MHSALESATLVAERHHLSEFVQSACNRPAEYIRFSTVQHAQRHASADPPILRRHRVSDIYRMFHLFFAMVR